MNKPIQFDTRQSSKGFSLRNNDLTLDFVEDVDKVFLICSLINDLMMEYKYGRLSRRLRQIREARMLRSEGECRCVEEYEAMNVRRKFLLCRSWSNRCMASPS